MHAGEALPHVSTGTPMPDVFHEMSKKAWNDDRCLEPDGRLAGILTDATCGGCGKTSRATLEMTAGSA